MVDEKTNSEKVKQTRDKSEVDKLIKCADGRLEAALKILEEFKQAGAAQDKSQREKARQYREMKLSKLQNYTDIEIIRHIDEKLGQAEECIKPTDKKKFVTKILHDLTQGGEFLEFIFASTAIFFNPTFGIFPLMTGIASILGLISGVIEWEQLNKRINKIEEDRQALEQLVLALAAYHRKIEQKMQTSENEKNIKWYLGHALAYWEARLQRDELNLKRLDAERWVTRVEVVLSIIALGLVLTTSIQVELLLLSMVVIDKLVYAIYAVSKTHQAHDELKPLQALIKNENEIIKGDMSHRGIHTKFNETQERVKKRNWKQWFHLVAFPCAVLSLVVAPISASPITIIALVSTAMAVDGGTKLFWFLYHYARFENKKQLAANESQYCVINKKKLAKEEKMDKEARTSDVHCEQPNKDQERKHYSFLGTRNVFFPPIKKALYVREDLQDCNGLTLTT